MKCLSLREEFSFHELINCVEDNAAKQWLRKRNLNSAIDVGCGSAGLLGTLYHALGIKLCVGVDHEEESVLVTRLNEAWRKNKRVEKNYVSFFDAYSRDHNTDPSDVLKDKLTALNFKEHIQFRPQSMIQLARGTETFDLVVISNALHYLTLKDAEEVLTWASHSVREGALLYVRFKEKPHCQSLSRNRTDYNYAILKIMCEGMFGNEFVHYTMTSEEEKEGGNEGEEYVHTNLKF